MTSRASARTSTGSAVIDEVFDDDAPSLAASYAFCGEVVEVFAYTSAGYEEWARRGISEFRPVIVHMLCDGVPLRGGAALESLRATWTATLAAGPSMSRHELDLRRYHLTDLLDGNLAAFHEEVERELDALGGRLQAGFVR